METAPFTARPRNGLTTLIIIALILSGLFLYLEPAENKAVEVPLSTFIESVKLGEVDSVNVKDNKLEVALKDGKQIFTIKESSQSISDILEGVQPETVSKLKIAIEDTDSSNFWLNLLVSVVPFLLI